MAKLETRFAAGLMLAGIVALALVVRFAGIGSHLSVDDAYSWLLASSPNAHTFLHRLAANENTPPLFYLVLMLVPDDGPGWLRVTAAVPGILISVVVFYAMRRRLGERASLLAALAIAVSPFLITYSNLARGFMLADLALLVALWALLSLADGETTAKWGLFVAAGVIAVYTEYASVIFLVALIASALWLGVPRRRSTALAGALILVTLAPWIPQIVRAENQVGVTKFNPMFATPSLNALRDAVASLTLGENGGTHSSVGRWCLFALMLAVTVGGAFALRRGWEARSDRGRRPILLLAATVLLTLAGYALAAPVGIDVFTQRYLTILIPLVAVLGAAALTSIESRPLTIVASVLLLGLGAVEIGRRYHGEWEPDLTPIRLAATSMHPRAVLTNTPVVLYYLRSLRPRFDRPYNLGPGDAQTCARPCLIIDDVRVHGGALRTVAGAQTAFGPYRLTLEG